MADKYSISASVYTSSYDATSDTIHYEGHVEFGAWYYYGVRLELWVDGTCVDQSSGYTTSTYGSCCYVSYDWTRSKTHSEANPSWGLYAYSDTVDGVGGVGEDDSVTGTVYCGPKYSYAVKYDANGGSGAPSAQTKWHGETLALSSAKPTRSGYTFVGWNTDKTAVKSQYAPGASYTGNAALTLYAVWKLAYVAPTVTVSAVRCTSSGAASQSGTYAKVTGAIKADTSINSANKLTKHVIEYRKVGASSWTAGATVTDSAATASVSSVVGGGNIATASAYEVRVTAYDSGGSGYAVATVPAQFRLVDFGYKGKSVGIGAVASDSASRLDVGIPAYLSMGGTLRAVSDWVESYGTTDSWKWRKWASGFAEASRVYTLTVTSWNQWGGVYESAQIVPSLTFPFTFAETPEVYATISSSNGEYALGVEHQGAADATKTKPMYVTRGNAGSSNDKFGVTVLLRGRWR